MDKKNTTKARGAKTMAIVKTLLVIVAEGRKVASQTPVVQ